MNRENKPRPHHLLCPLALLLTLACFNAHGQVSKPDNHKNDPRNNIASKTIPDAKGSQVDDSVIEERLVELALKGPLYDASFHEVKIANYKVKSAKKSWFNLLTVS